MFVTLCICLHACKIHIFWACIPLPENKPNSPSGMALLAMSDSTSKVIEHLYHRKSRPLFVLRGMSLMY